VVTIGVPWGLLKTKRPSEKPAISFSRRQRLTPAPEPRLAPRAAGLPVRDAQGKGAWQSNSKDVREEWFITMISVACTFVTYFKLGMKTCNPYNWSQ
jgi:hypothetical protein